MGEKRGLTLIPECWSQMRQNINPDRNLDKGHASVPTAIFFLLFLIIFRLKLFPDKKIKQEFNRFEIRPMKLLLSAQTWTTSLLPTPLALNRVFFFFNYHMEPCYSAAQGSRVWEAVSCLLIRMLHHSLPSPVWRRHPAPSRWRRLCVVGESPGREASARSLCSAEVLCELGRVNIHLCVSVVPFIKSEGCGWLFPF